MRCTNTFIANFDANTALTDGRLVVANGDARSFRIPSSRYQGMCAPGSVREFRAIKHGHVSKYVACGTEAPQGTLRGTSERFCSALERGVTPWQPLHQRRSKLGVSVLGSVT